MQSIKSFSGKMLYLAHEMYNQNIIDKKQKSLFKDLIFNMSPSITSVYEQYIQNGTILTLKNQLITAIRKQKQNDSWDSESSNSKKSSKKGRSMKIIIPPRNIQKVSNQIRQQ